MKKAIFLPIIINLAIYLLVSCSAPADGWSCSKLRKEIEICKVHLMSNEYNYSNGSTSYETYKKNDKAFREAISYYKSRLSTCNEISKTKIKESKDLDQPKNEFIEDDISDLHIEGIYTSSEAKVYGIEKLVVERLSDYVFNAKLYLVDGSAHSERLLAKKKRLGIEYHTNNMFGEYYRFTMDGLGSFDKDGILYTFKKYKGEEKDLSPNNDLGHTTINDVIEGVWSSSEAETYGFKMVTIEKISSNKYKSFSALIDGSRYIENLRLDSNGEYHNEDRWEEYYKLINTGLGVYDSDGLIFTLYKSE